MFVTPAFAQAAGGAAGAGSIGQLLMPILFIVPIFYFLMIRPQQKKMKEMKAMLDALRRGDQVMTQGGLIGKVSKVGENDDLEVEIAEGVKVKMKKFAVIQVMNKTEPTKAA